MHEMGIAAEIVEAAGAALPPEDKDARVETIHLKIGRMAGVVKEYLTFCMEIAAKDTPLEGACVNIDEIPVNVRCRDCGIEWEPQGQGPFICPRCQSLNAEILSGNELNVVSMDVAD